MTDLISLLSQISLFKGLTAAELQELLPCLGVSQRTYPKDSFLRLAGDPADFIGIVLDGTIQIMQEDYNGNRHILSAVSSGHIFAEAFACADLRVLPVSLYAATPCDILYLDKARLLTPCSTSCAFHTRLTQNLLRVVAEKNILLSRKLNCISQKTTAEKILAFLNEQARLCRSREFTIPYDRQALADYLGVERSALSAELSRLQKKGLLLTHKSSFKLL